MADTSEEFAATPMAHEDAPMSLRSAMLLWIALSVLGWTMIVGLSLPVVNLLF